MNLKPDLLIYDFFQPWAPKIALSQGIRSVYFATSGAAPFSFFHHQFTYGDTCNFPYQEIYLLDREKPNPYLKSLFKILDADDEHFGFGNLYMSCEIVLVKGSRLIEDKFIDYLSVLCKKKVVPTGLLVQDCIENEKITYLLQWLNEKEESSTLFICFGSEHFMSKDQIQEMAKGLELCNVNFIWAIKISREDQWGTTLEEALPEGFLGRVSGRGLVVEEWVPQVKILSHPSIGAFASHCGWSSVMESLYFGVPVIGIPVRYDQPINVRLLVNAGVGVEVVKANNGHISGEEIAKAILNVSVEKKGEDIRYAARTLSERIKDQEEHTEDEAAEEILRLCLKNRSLS